MSQLSVSTRQKRASKEQIASTGSPSLRPHVHLPAQNLAFLRPGSARSSPARLLLREAGPQRLPLGRLLTGAEADLTEAEASLPRRNQKLAR